MESTSHLLYTHKSLSPARRRVCHYPYRRSAAHQDQINGHQTISAPIYFADNIKVEGEMPNLMWVAPE